MKLSHVCTFSLSISLLDPLWLFVCAHTHRVKIKVKGILNKACFYGYPVPSSSFCHATIFSRDFHRRCKGEEIRYKSDGKQSGLSTVVTDLFYSHATFHLVFIASVLAPSAKAKPRAFVYYSLLFQTILYRVAFQLARLCTFHYPIYIY